MLTTAARLGSYRPIPDAAAGVLIECLKAADAWLKGRIGTAVESDSYTRRLSGEGVAMLRLPDWPLTAVSSLTLDGAALTVLVGSATDTGQDVFADADGLLWMRNDDVFTKGRGNILITYTAGYASTAIPEDLQQACVVLTWLIAEERTRIGIGGKTLGPEQINLVVRNSKDYDTMIEQAIRNARRGF